MSLEQKQVRVSFHNTQGKLPLYVNATLVNLTTDGSNVIIEFGFIDPLFIAQPQQEVQVEQQPQPESIQVNIDTLFRVSISLSVAEQLIKQLENILKLVPRDIK